MSTEVLSLRVDAVTKQRLARLSTETGHSVSHYIAEALNLYLDELEYAAEIQRDAAKYRQDKSELTELNDLMKSLNFA